MADEQTTPPGIPISVAKEIAERYDGLWYFVGRDGQTHGPFSTSRKTVKAERARSGRSMQMASDPAQTTQRRMVAVDDVARNGSLIVGSLSMLSLLSSWLGGFDAIHPFLALLLLVASVVFYCITLVPNRSERSANEE